MTALGWIVAASTWRARLLPGEVDAALPRPIPRSSEPIAWSPRPTPKPHSISPREARGPRPLRATFGQSCLLARRLIERGVPFVSVLNTGWDTHATRAPTPGGLDRSEGGRGADPDVRHGVFGPDRRPGRSRLARRDAGDRDG
ncbi:MAG: DUF1501 domain-containing protein [Singulisphaera sp.]